VPIDRIEVIPAGIDPLPPAAPPTDLRWRPGALRILTVGRYSREKRLGVLVAAVRAATDRGIDVHLALVGHGHEERALRRQAEDLGVADRVTFAGPYPRASLRSVYESADVFAFASTVDTQAFVLNEAAHEALPLLVADPDVNPVVAPGRSALVVSQDGDGFADGFARLRDPVLRLRLGSAARRRAARYTEAAQTRRLSRVLAEAAGQPLPFPQHAPVIDAAPIVAVE
jgi:glycosyltransferase involved in cell wall biosynthesis